MGARQCHHQRSPSINVMVNVKNPRLADVVQIYYNFKADGCIGSKLYAIETGVCLYNKVVLGGKGASYSTLE
jgi:hypothetical protein